MQIPSAESLLRLWELGLGDEVHERGTLLLHAAHPEATPEAISAIPLGRRNEALLSLRAALFGGHLDGVADCPACGESIEVGLPVPISSDAGVTVELPAPLVVAAAGYEVEVRLPTADDILGLPNGSVETAARALFDRCLVEARRDGDVVPADAVPANVIDQVDEALAAADPQGFIEIVTTCPSCATASTLRLEPGAYLWAELHRWAAHTLRDVHELASAYGWHESDILALSPTRRRAYLEMLPA